MNLCILDIFMVWVLVFSSYIYLSGILFFFFSLMIFLSGKEFGHILRTKYVCAFSM